MPYFDSLFEMMRIEDLNGKQIKNPQTEKEDINKKKYFVTIHEKKLLTPKGMSNLTDYSVNASAGGIMKSIKQNSSFLSFKVIG